MYSKIFCFATFVAVLCACSARPPWHNEPIGQEINLVFDVRNNLLYVPTVTLDERAGRYLIGTAQPASVIDTHFAKAGPHLLRMNRRATVTLTAVAADLHGVGDAIIGADAWVGSALTIDYRAGLVTLQREGIHPDLMTVFAFTDQPMITVSVDGKLIPVVVDSTSPDTLVLPGNGSRRQVHVQMAGVDFRRVDVGSGNVQVARIGNRLLSNFLVTIDYRRRVVGLFPIRETGIRSLPNSRGER